jgi:hypothetical protein
VGDGNELPGGLALDAGSVPALRRELANWYGGPQGVQYYLNAITLGRQQIRPPGPPEKVATTLATAEATRLRDGELYFVDEDMCALLNAAHPSMPVFAPRPHDLPSRVGFAVFATPIFMYATSEAGHEGLIQQLRRESTHEFQRLSKEMDAGTTEIVAVSWSPATNPHWPAGGLLLSFYAPSWGAFDNPALSPAVRQRLRSMLPTMTVDNEAAIAWRPDEAAAEAFQLPTAAADRGTLSWTRLVFATFQLAAQANLGETTQLPTPRPERRRTQRAGLPERDVRIVRLHRNLVAARDGEQSAASREWRHGGSSAVTGATTGTRRSTTIAPSGSPHT